MILLDRCSNVSESNRCVDLLDAHAMVARDQGAMGYSSISVLRHDDTLSRKQSLEEAPFGLRAIEEL